MRKSEGSGGLASVVLGPARAFGVETLALVGRVLLCLPRVR